MKKRKIAVIGLGYVGLPLACALSKHFDVYGFDTNKKRVKDLENNIDSNNDLEIFNMYKKNILFTTDEKVLKKTNIFIVTVPTPVFKNNYPNLNIINKATVTIAKYLKKRDFVIYESTVYPGFTDEISIPLLEKKSGLKVNTDFICGYSPERINPGDKKRKIENIKKIVAASNSKGLKEINYIYKKIIKAGVYKTDNIKIAEAAKIIENSQRDINIAFMNELAVIFNKLNIDTFKVLDAANTKWNFLNFVPGLVGGHCIGVDPYYLAYKSKQIGYNPKIILSGRKINNGMSKFYSDLVLKNLDNPIKNKKVLILGATFKENCKDLRNSKVEDLCRHIIKKKINIEIYDPQFKNNEILFSKLGLKNSIPKKNFYNYIVLAVPHSQFLIKGIKKLKKWGTKNYKLLDIKGVLKND